MPYFARTGWVTRSTDEGSTYIESILPMAVGSVDRVEEIPERLQFLFDWDADRAAALVAAEADGARVVQGMAAEIATAGPLEKDSFRDAAQRVRQATGVKGRALFHPIRVALTAADSGPELDLAVPAIDRGAALPAAAGIVKIPSCAARLEAVVSKLASGPDC
jgi:glutamyl/glutaminyl-tRNA synthetase